MAQVCLKPNDTAAQPDATPAVAATGTGTVTSDLLPSAMPSWPLTPRPVRAQWRVGYLPDKRGEGIRSAALTPAVGGSRGVGDGARV